MTTRKLGSLAAALGVAALIFSHGALGQSSQVRKALSRHHLHRAAAAGTP